MSDLTDEDVRRKKHLQMEQLAYDADIKRIDRDLEEVDMNLHRYEGDLARLKATIEDLHKVREGHVKKKDFLATESDRIKRALVDLR